MTTVVPSGTGRGHRRAPGVPSQHRERHGITDGVTRPPVVADDEFASVKQTARAIGKAWCGMPSREVLCTADAVGAA